MAHLRLILLRCCTSLISVRSCFKSHKVSSAFALLLLPAKMASAAQPMDPPVFCCYGVVRRVDHHALQMEGAIAPRYATFHRQCDYIGLRTTAFAAWERVKEESMEPAEFLIFKATFSAEGFLHYATSSISPGVPRLHKMLYHDGQEWNCWRWNGSLPLNENCPHTGVPFVRVDVHPFGVDQSTP